MCKTYEKLPDSSRALHKSRGKEPEFFTYLNLVPVEWKLAKACGDCETKYRIARRISKIVVISVNWDQCIDNWIL